MWRINKIYEKVKSILKNKMLNSSTTASSETSTNYIGGSVTLDSTNWTGTSGTSIAINQPLTWSTTSATWSPYLVRRYEVNWSKVRDKHISLLTYINVEDDSDGKGSEVKEWSNTTKLQLKIIDKLLREGVLEDIIVEKELLGQGLTTSTTTTASW